MSEAIKYEYVPIFNTSQDEFKNPDIIGWKLCGDLQGWLPGLAPPRVIEHYMLQYYNVTIRNKRATIYWSRDEERLALQKYGKTIDCAVMM